MRALERRDPRALGRYRILARIGAGGMAIVYFGRSTGGRAVAVKAVHREFARKERYRDRFRQEIEATRAAGGRYSPGVLDADPDAEIPWLATEFLPGMSLREAITELGPMPAATVWPLAAGLAEALHALHRAGVLHLDVKPANVLLTADGPRLIDFGLAARPPQGVLLLDGTPIGSRGFAAPEQAEGHWCGPASDVHALGATLAYAATGNPGGQAADPELRELIAACLRADPVTRPGLPGLTSYLAERDRPANWLPAPLTVEIARRAAEAESPPASAEARPGGLDRRTLLLSGGSVAAVGGIAGAWALLREPSAPDPAPSTSSSAPSATTSSVPAAAPKPRTVEFYVFGNAPLKSLTTITNNQPETVRDRKLPYQRLVQIPPAPHKDGWKVEYHFGAGNFTIVVNLDGSQIGSAGGFSTREDQKKAEEGQIGPS